MSAKTCALPQTKLSIYGAEKDFCVGREIKLVLQRILFILQHINTSEFRICLKELYADQHDPVNVSYAVLAGGFGGKI